MSQGMSRRYFLGVVAAGSVVGACSGPDTDAADTSGTGNGQAAPKAGEYQESPMLATRVKAGDLPPIKERLPKDLFIVQPGSLVDDDPTKMQPGRFGGTLQLPRDPNFDSAVYLASV